MGVREVEGGSRGLPALWSEQGRDRASNMWEAQGSQGGSQQLPKLPRPLLRKSSFSS